MLDMAARACDSQSEMIGSLIWMVVTLLLVGDLKFCCYAVHPMGFQPSMMQD